MNFRFRFRIWHIDAVQRSCCKHLFPKVADKRRRRDDGWSEHRTSPLQPTRLVFHAELGIQGNSPHYGCNVPALRSDALTLSPAVRTWEEED